MNEVEEILADALVALAKMLKENELPLPQHFSWTVWQMRFTVSIDNKGLTQ